ncbi:hypothetical protein SESBI_35892 [Sesbania bispinosa]|nr:hypothetical protein SESBI_35892 [Sesbania bispinosa]
MIDLCPAQIRSSSPSTMVVPPPHTTTLVASSAITALHHCMRVVFSGSPLFPLYFVHLPLLHSKSLQPLI